MFQSSFAARLGALSLGAAALVLLFASSSAEARFGGHPGATGRANGGTCNRCHSPQTYEGLSIELPTEYRHDCFMPVQGGYQLVNSFYAIPYTPAAASSPLTEIPVILRLQEPEAVADAAAGVGIFCPDQGQVQPAQECTTPADCATGDLCQDYGTVLQEVEIYGIPGSCTSGEAQFSIEADCGEEGALCANDSCARRVERPVNSCGQTLPGCQTPNWAGFAAEVTGLTPPTAGVAVFKGAAGETEVRQADYNGEESQFEVNHSAPRPFAEGETNWELTLVAPRYTSGNPVQDVTIYASANACNHNGVADIGDITAINQIPVYFEVPGGGGHTGPDCLEGEVCRGGQVLGEDLLCSCPDGFAFTEDATTGLKSCSSAGFCSHSGLPSNGSVGFGIALLAGLGLAFRRRRQ